MDEKSPLPRGLNRVSLNTPPLVIGFDDRADEAHPLAGLSTAERIRSREHLLASVLADVLKAEQSAQLS